MCWDPGCTKRFLLLALFCFREAARPPTVVSCHVAAPATPSCRSEYQDPVLLIQMLCGDFLTVLAKHPSERRSLPEYPENSPCGAASLAPQLASPESQSQTPLVPMQHAAPFLPWAALNLKSQASMAKDRKENKATEYHRVQRHKTGCRSVRVLGRSLRSGMRVLSTSKKQAAFLPYVLV